MKPLGWFWYGIICLGFCIAYETRDIGAFLFVMAFGGFATALFTSYKEGI